MKNQQLKGNFIHFCGDESIQLRDDVLFLKSGMIHKGTHNYQLPDSYNPLDIACFECLDKIFTLIGGINILRQPEATSVICNPIWLIKDIHLIQLGEPVFTGTRLKIQHLQEWECPDKVLEFKFSEPKDFFYLSNYIFLVTQIISLYMNQPVVIKYGEIGINDNYHQFFLYSDFASGGIHHKMQRLHYEDLVKMSPPEIKNEVSLQRFSYSMENGFYSFNDISYNGNSVKAVDILVNQLMSEQKREYGELVSLFGENFYEHSSSNVSLLYSYEIFKKLLKVILNKQRLSNEDYKTGIDKLYSYFPISELFDDSTHFNEWAKYVKSYRDTRIGHFETSTTYYDPSLDTDLLTYSQFIFRIILAVFLLHEILELPEAQLGQIIARQPFIRAKESVSKNIFEL